MQVVNCNKVGEILEFLTPLRYVSEIEWWILVGSVENIFCGKVLGFLRPAKEASLLDILFVFCTSIAPMLRLIANLGETMISIIITEI